MRYMDSGAAPCADCGTEGGNMGCNTHRPWRARGLCYACYQQRWSRKDFEARHATHPVANRLPCLSCGGSGNIQARQLCVTCYHRALDQGITARYPDCGAVPVPYVGYSHSEHPEPWPADYDDAVTTGAMLWARGDGGRAAHAVYPHAFDAAAEIAEARRDAAWWLLERPHAPLLEWPDPSLALFGAATPLEHSPAA